MEVELAGSRVERDLVFISYSRQDAAWLQRFEILLKPLLRDRRLHLWADTRLRVGDRWATEIVGGIARSRVALLLVSADFLASDFIMERELPALREHAVTLAPVLVGDCLWDRVPELSEVQWLHDPRRDGPLNLVRGGTRDQRIREVCDRLLDIVPVARTVQPALGQPAEPSMVSPAAEVSLGADRGPLVGIPPLPPGYVVRDELAGLIEAVIAGVGSAVGLTGEVTAFGLHGQGGIGKTVLATALAGDDGIRRRFPDGVHWVTLGENADVLAGQLEMLRRLGDHASAPRTVADAIDRLRAVLHERRLLLIVDDVWTAAAASAFRVTGPRGQLVYTSRDPMVLTAVRARAHRVDVLSVAAARELAGRIVGVPRHSLPAVVDRVVRQVEGVPLAVALLTAVVRGGRSWDEVAAELDRHRDVFGAHPYANTFKAMQVAIGGLPGELAAALLSLAVFPPDTRIPMRAVAHYWAHSRGRSPAHTAEDLDQLVAAQLMQRDGDGDEATITFHDLQHHYLLLHAELLSGLHAELVAALRALLPPGSEREWWRLPDDEHYVWDHLVEHLLGAAGLAELAGTVTDPVYLARRITLFGVHAADDDLAKAAEALADDAALAWWCGWVSRHAHVLAASVIGADGRVCGDTAATMLSWLQADPTHAEHDIQPERLAMVLPDPYLRIRWGLTAPTSALIRVLTGQTGEVNAVAWSPDGTRLASASQTVHIWNPATGQSHHIPADHAESVTAVAWSPDGTRLASTGFDRTIRIWNPDTGQLLDTLTGHTHWVTAVAWSPDSTRLASTGFDRTIRIWNPDTGQLLDTLTGHTHWVTAVVWSPDSTRLATAGDDRTVRIWNGATGQPLASIAGAVRDVSWSPDSTHLATVGPAGTVRIWNPDTGQIFVDLADQTHGLSAVAWSPDGTRLASSGVDRTIRIWDPITMQLLSSLTSHTDSVSAAAWSPDGTLLATASKDRTVRIWKPATGQPAASPGRTDAVVAVCAAAGDARVGTISDFGTVRIWDAATGDSLTTISDSPTTISWSPDRTRFVTASFDDRTIRIRDSATGGVFTSFDGPADPVTVMALSPDNTRLATAYGYDTIKVWDSATGEPIASLVQPIGRATVLEWSPDGSLLAASTDGMIRLWNPTIRRPIAIGNAGSAQTMAWSPNSRELAVLEEDGTLRLWDRQKDFTAWRRLLHRPPSPATRTGEQVAALAWSPDGSMLATASASDVQIREIATGSVQRSLTGRPGPVHALAWSANGLRLAAIGEDNLTVHDLAHHHTPAHLQLPPLNHVSWVGSAIAVASGAGLILIELAHPQA